MIWRPGYPADGPVHKEDDTGALFLGCIDCMAEGWPRRRLGASVGTFHLGLIISRRLGWILNGCIRIWELHTVDASQIATVKAPTDFLSHPCHPPTDHRRAPPCLIARKMEIL
jgi:hypothetical protein